MARHKADKITQELLAARKEAIKRIYFEQGADRSFSKLMPIVQEKYGGPSKRLIMEWSRLERWPEEARRFDAQRAALALRQAEEIVGAADLDEAETLRQVARQYLKAIVDRTLSLQEAKTAMSIVESALRAFADLTGTSARRRAPTVQNNTLVTFEGSPAQRALAALELNSRVGSSAETTATAVTEATLEPPPPAAASEAPAVEDRQPTARSLLA